MSMKKYAYRMTHILNVPHILREGLVHPNVPPSMIIGFVVYDEAAKAQLMNYGVEEKKIAIRNSYYY